MTPNRPSPNVVWHRGQVTPAERQDIFGQLPMTIWLTGLSAAGKSTLAFAFERELVDSGRACYVLDGDNIRHGLNSNLGFSPDDRAENIRRVAEVAKLMNDAGLVVITAFISPFRADRTMARAIVGERYFREVFVSTSLAVCEARDPKGLYNQARTGSLPEFTGVSSPYEVPERPNLVIDTASLAVESAVSQLMALVSAP